VGEIEKRKSGLKDFLQFAVARHVAATAHCGAGFEIHGLVDATDNFGDPVEAAAQNALYPTLECCARNGAARAGATELDFDRTDFDVSTHKNQVTTVGLNRRAHQVNQSSQRREPGAPLFIGQGSSHVVILPAVGEIVTEGWFPIDFRDATQPNSQRGPD